MASPVFKDFEELSSWWQNKRSQLGRIVFTNGCFDLLHAGHVQYLEEARALGDFLVLGLNDDGSIRRLKGPKRPIVEFSGRAAVLAALRSIDLVVGFSEDTPYSLIAGIKPHVLVKGGDWGADQIVGSDLVLGWGGAVRSLSFKEQHSTTDIIGRILERHGRGG